MLGLIPFLPAEVPDSYPAIHRSMDRDMRPLDRSNDRS